MRPSVRPFGAFLLAAALLGSACASAGAARGGISHANGASDLILRIDLQGGFIAPQVLLRRLPELALYGDGRLITSGPQIEIYPGPALQSKMTDLSSWLPRGSLGPDQPFRTDEMRVYVLPYQAQQDLPQRAKDWPAGGFGGFLPVVDLAGIRCGTVSGPPLQAVLSA